MNFNLIFFCSSPVQKLVWVDSIKWFKVLFPSWIRLIFCIRERPDVLCASKTQVCLDDTNDEYLNPRHYHCMIYQGTPYARGFPRTLTVRNAFWLKRALIFSHIGTVYTNIHCPFTKSVWEAGTERPAVWNPQGIAQLLFVLLKHLKPISVWRPLCYALCKQQVRAAAAPWSFQPKCEINAGMWVQMRV